jgi:hypothetical protein
MRLSNEDTQYMTVVEIEELLIAAYIAEYAHTHEDGYDTVHFTQMIEKFASDDFYPLHDVAKAYLKLDPIFRTEIAIPLAENSVIAGHPDTTIRTFSKGM